MSSYDVSGVNYGSATAAKTYAKTGADNTSLAGRESTESSTDMDFNDFLQLMVVQMTNQDFMNPTDNTEYMSQMAQFASMQAMNELASYSKTNYAMGLVGKEVTASRYTQTGELDTTTGTVTRVSLVGNEYKLYVDGKEYELEEIMQINEPVEDGVCQVDPSKLHVSYTDLTEEGGTFSWTLPTEDATMYRDLVYQAYYSTDPDFKTVEAVEENGTAFGGRITNATLDEDLTAELTGLEPDTTYYVNVVVTDANGNKAVYQSVSFKTKSVE